MVVAERIRARLRRVAVSACAALLVMGLAPATGSAAPIVPAVSESTDAATDTVRAVEGQALVLYHASDGGVRLLSEDGEDDAAVLEDGGFTVVQTWDFSVVDEAIDEGIVPLSTDDGIQAGLSDDDLRVALVVREGADPDELVSELEELDFVEAAQPNHVIELSSTAPNDTYYADWQYGLHGGDAGIDLEAALAARGESSTEANVVAVIDTGVDYTHPDLVDCMWHNPGIDGLPGQAGDVGYDFFENDGDPMPGTSTELSHGTHCAGVIAASSNNGMGVAGASSDTKIMALKDTGSDMDAAIFENCTISAYQYVIAAALAGENVVAISNSWNLGGYYPVLDYLVNQAGKVGAVSMFAAGNYYADTATLGSFGATVGLESPYAIVVASTNELNTLSAFSNYNATDVDLAAPGSNILSTVSTNAPFANFCPLLSQQAGRELAYYENFADYAGSPDAYEVTLERLDGEEVAETDYEAVTIEPVEDAAFGEPGLKVTLDATKLSAPSLYYAIDLSWRTDNFFAGGEHEASDYAVGATVLIDQEASPSDSVAFCGLRLANPNTGEEFMGDYVGASGFDDSSVFPAAIPAIDRECPEISVCAIVQFESETGGIEGSASCTITGIGVGVVAGDGVTEETSAYEPYGLMSGTSMSTPMIAGSFAQLAALYPDASALELRGMLIGSTVPVETSLQGTEKHTATDGHFSWDAALDDEPASANTWAVEADASTGVITVFGYGLSDATLLFDGQVVTPTAQDDGSIAFTAPASAFDGGRHRFDVSDASTGRTHNAAYVLPLADAQHELSVVNDLPGEIAGQAVPALVASDSALYLAARDGSYLFKAGDPSSDDWTRVSAPGNPWGGVENGLGHDGISYAAADGALYAFASVQTIDPGDGSMTEHVYAAAYEEQTDSWSPFAEIDAFSLPVSDPRELADISINASSCGDDAYCLIQCLFAATEDEIGFARMYRSNEAGAFEMVSSVEDGMFTEYVIGGLGEIDGRLCAVASGRFEQPSGEAGSADAGAASTTYGIRGLAFDAEDGSWTDLGQFEGAPALDEASNADVRLLSMAEFGPGFVVTGKAFAGIGDTWLLDFSTMTWKGLGTFGTDASTGSAVSSAAAYNGNLYLVATSALSASMGASGALCALPYASVEQILGLACPSADYTDVDHDAWYHECVDWAISNGIMAGYRENGVLTGLFGPDDRIARAQMAQVFYNQAGAPEVEPLGEGEGYADVAADAWYADAVAWATREGLFMGYDDSDRFGPDDALSREQMAVVLWRAAGEPTGAGDLGRFPDGEMVDAWARDAVAWAVGDGVISGYSDTGRLDPIGASTRAQMASVLMRSSDSIA